MTATNATGVYSPRGTITLSECTITQTGETVQTWMDACIATSINGQVNLNNCTCETDDGTVFYVFTSGGDIVIDGGTYKVTGNGTMFNSSANSSTPSKIVVKDGIFEGSLDSSIMGSSGSVEIQGGQFDTELPAGFSIPANCSKGTDAEGKTIVGPTLNIGFSDGSESVSIPSGAVIPEDKIPSKDGYALTFTVVTDGSSETLTPEQMKTKEITSSQTITVNATLDTPTNVSITVGTPEEDGSVTLTANAEHVLETVTYQYQWSKDGTVISGAESQMYKATESGSYTVEVKAVDGSNVSAGVSSNPQSVTVTPSQPDHYTVSFEAPEIPGWTKPADQTVVAGGHIDLTKITVPQGYVITDMESNGVSVDADTVVNSNMTVSIAIGIEASIDV